MCDIVLYGPYGLIEVYLHTHYWKRSGSVTLCTLAGSLFLLLVRVQPWDCGPKAESPMHTWGANLKPSENNVYSREYCNYHKRLDPEPSKHNVYS